MKKNIKILISFLIVVLLGLAVYYLMENYENQENEPNLPVDIIEQNNEELPKYDASTQAQFDAYIRENINTISPEPAVLGGSFYVTNLNWLRSNLAAIEYEDGHISLSAEVELDLSESGEIIVSNVYLTTPPDSLIYNDPLLTENQADIDLELILEEEQY
ncbi:MAG: hypothetical protein PHX76_03260 [Patescibacteria group bacterium]|nr:hypothetical protein [Patescibacteria group bacterium]MDD3939709.1 hypothetical protein [Patescibacteria group bacterium]MDD4444086.1 hypothetical protein [Patescibacteria group bacterium]NCU40012.1 hypothetical protein [Candidatus Falkowbacteria bacterium]